MGRKDFNKGMEAGARPFEEKFRQEQKRNQEWKQTFEEKFDSMKETNEAILDEMESREKEKFYKNHTIVDIKELEKGDRETLLSILFTLSEMEEGVTEYQQQFIRSVKRYLENTEDGERPENWSVLKDNDWSVIETIYGVDETKAIVQAVMIFLFLGYGNHEVYIDEYEDVFECFNLNKKGFGEIKEQIDVLWRVTGFQGLAEMYGYVPEEEVQEGQEQNISGEKENLKKLYGTHGELEELRITENIELFSDGEELIFENKRLIVAAKIGTGFSGIAAKATKQIFKNCEILIDGEMKEDSTLIMTNEGTVIFENCTIRSGKQLFIDAQGNTNLEIKNSYLDCGGRIFEERHGEASVSVRHSLIECKAEDCQNRLFVAGEIEVFDTVFHGEQSNASPDYSSKLLGSVFDAHKVLHIDECKFYDFIELPFMVNTEIYNSVFEKCCVKITSGAYKAPYEYKEKGGLFKNCEFEDCIFTQSAPDCSMRFENINLKSCVGVVPTKYMKDVTSEGGFLVVWMEEKIELSGCRFSDWSYEQYKDILDKEGHNPFWYATHWVLLSEEDRTAIAAGYGSKITNCQFENLKLDKLSLIGGFPYATSSYTLQNCQFENIQVGKNGILKKEFRHEKGGMFRTKTVIKETVMKVENCIGL